MKNKNIYLLVAGIILILGFIFSFNNIKTYYFVNKGNKNYHAKKYEVAKKYYEKAFKIKENKIINSNLIINDYENKKYSEVLKRKGNKDFLNGNSIVKLSENKGSKEKLEESLEYYKKEMIKNGDINIKKNYEIVLKDIKENQKKNQKNQKNKQNQQPNKQNQKQNKENKQNQKNQQQGKQNSKKDKQKDKKSSEKNKDKEKQNNKSDKNKQNKTDKGQNNKGKVRKKEEIKAVLKRLEGSEKQAFKNNEKIMNVGTSKDEKNRW